MRNTVTTLAVILALLGPTTAVTQMEPSIESSAPFKLGTFENEGRIFVGIVLRDQLIIELGPANTDLEGQRDYAAMPMPEDMLGLIERYDYGLKYRLYEIVNHLVENDRLTVGMMPGYIHSLNDVRTLAPIQYPGKILNAAVNFYSHISEGATPEARQEAIRRRQENLGVPYLFLKPARGAVVGNGDNIVIPDGRDRIDWEVELGTVIGRRAKYVSAGEAENYVFGYMVSIDVSDRGGRPPGGYGSGSDWFVGKGHDTFAPEGPWIVPKEFYGDPMQRLHQQLTIDGVTVQEAKAGDMIHSLWELIEYGSSIITLYPGDVLNSGTSGGTTAGAAAQRGQSGYLQPGETIEASIEGIGTLRMPIVAGPPLPDDLAGSYLPPVGSYRNRR
jgi:2-keto-4-pentenoate hydratase/2-oxohepta-3-ene-1,7-dioic acid hydratase in catechol pathway|tara:strand:- start:365 stop:1528 length:1164 start_codon:yes stop_codon:yes gene_type:complete